MCAQGMWRLVKAWRQPTEQALHRSPARLSNWAATRFTDEGETLVLALEVQTYLTVVFPYGDGELFQERFSRALTASLEDLGVDRTLLAEEVSSMGPVCLSRLKDPQLREALEAAQFPCGVERLYHDDLRKVQRNLNDFPHNLPPDYVPAVAVRRLFGRPPLTPA
jgi:hypothetical protein